MTGIRFTVKVDFANSVYYVRMYIFGTSRIYKIVSYVIFVFGVTHCQRQSLLSGISSLTTHGYKWFVKQKLRQKYSKLRLT